MTEFTLSFSFRAILTKDGVLYVKLRAGQLSYKEDPMGWRSLLAQTVTLRNSEARTFKVTFSLNHGKTDAPFLLISVLYMVTLHISNQKDADFLFCSCILVGMVGRPTFSS